jgi:hypothetical protein
MTNRKCIDGERVGKNKIRLGKEEVWGRIRRGMKTEYE